MPKPWGFLLLPFLILTFACGEASITPQDDADSKTSDSSFSAASCGKEEEGPLATIVCSSLLLSSMDIHLQQLVERVTAELDKDGQGQSLADDQQAWKETRSACLGANLPEECLTQVYAARIHQLRAQFPALRQSGESSIARGPFALDCRGLDDQLSVTLIDADKGLAYLEQNGRGFVLMGAAGSLGSKYEAIVDGKDATFYIHGSQSLLTLPDEPEHICRMDVSS